MATDSATLDQLAHLSPTDLADIRHEIEAIVMWQARNQHRNDPCYRTVQKPANERHLARLNKLLAKEES
jgi:hypothetical protein